MADVQIQDRRKSAELAVLNPKAKIYVPLEFAWQGTLKVKPYEYNYSYCDEKLVCSCSDEVCLLHQSIIEIIQKGIDYTSLRSENQKAHSTMGLPNQTQDEARTN